MELDETIYHTNCSWEPVPEAFKIWLSDKEQLLKPGLLPEPTIKVLTFLALLETNKACTYEDIRKIFKNKTVIRGNIPDNTLRTSVLNLGRTLERSGHSLELKSYRGRFELIKRTKPHAENNSKRSNKVILLLDPPAITAEEIANTLVEKAMLPFHGLYFLEWSARWWETYSSKEAESRMCYEANALKKLHILDQLDNEVICFVGLAPGEGLAEIEILKIFLRESHKCRIHYLAVDSSPRLLRDHIGLLKEIFTPEIENERLLCAGVVADIFKNLKGSIERAKLAFVSEGILNTEYDFLPSNSNMLATYLGNCLGNNSYDQEADFFSMVHSAIKNRPLEILVGVSVLRKSSDIYKRTWDDFLLQTPQHLLHTKKLLKSSNDSQAKLPEFTLPTSESDKILRCPAVVPSPYLVRHEIQGQIYRFYYRLSYDLELSYLSTNVSVPLPRGTLILLYNIIKYNIKTLVSGIEKCGLFKIRYDENYHQLVDTENGKREYAVFSAFVEK